MADRFPSSFEKVLYDSQVPRLIEELQKHALTATTYSGRTRALNSSGVSRDLADKVMDTISVKDFGAVGDGATNDRAAIQAALDYNRDRGGGAVYVPKGTYIIDYPVQVWDDTVLYGDGEASLIKNTNTTSTETLAKSCVFFGSYAREDGDDITWYACNNVTANDYGSTFSRVTTTTASQAANFSAGDVVLVRDNTGVGTPPTTDWRYIEINRVVSVNAASGIIELEEPIGYAATDCYIGKQPGTNFYPQWPGPSTRHIVHNSVLQDLAFYSEQNYWCQRTGFYKCMWKNLFIEKSLGLVYGNGFSHSIIDGIRGNFWYRAIEIATASSSTTIRNVIGAYRPRPDATDEKWDDMWDKAELIAIHGGCRRMHLSDVLLEAKGYPGAQILRVDGEDNLIERLNVHAPRIEGACVAFGAPNSTNINKRNTVRNSNFSTDVVVEPNPYLQAVPSDFNTLVASSPYPSVWLRADDIAGTAGSTVTTWTGVGGRTSAVLGAGTPTLQTSALNNRNTVRFDGASYMTVAKAMTNVNELFVVCKGVSGTVVGGAGGTSVKLPYYENGSVKTSRGTVRTIASDDGNWHVYNFEINDTDPDEYVRDGTTTVLDTGSNLPATFQIGADNGADFLKGEVAEVILYSGELGATNRSIVDAYLAKRYALYSNFPAGTYTMPNGADYYIYIYNNAGEIEDPCVEGCRFYGNIASAAVRISAGSASAFRCRIANNYFEKTGSMGWYSISGTANTYDIRGNSSPTTSQLMMQAGPSYLNTTFGGATWRRRKIWTFPAGVLRQGDILQFSAAGSCSGTAGTKIVRFFVGTTEAGTTETGGALIRQLSMAASFADRFYGECTVHIVSGSIQQNSSVITPHGVVPGVGTVTTTVDTNAVALRVSFDSYASVDPDNVTVLNTNCRIIRPYET